MCIYIYIYIYNSLCMYVYIYIYIYTHARYIYIYMSAPLHLSRAWKRQPDSRFEGPELLLDEDVWSGLVFQNAIGHYVWTLPYSDTIASNLDCDEDTYTKWCMLFSISSLMVLMVLIFVLPILHDNVICNATYCDTN